MSLTRADVQGHVRSRIDATRQAVGGHIDTTINGVKKIIDTGFQSAGELASLHPVKAATGLVRGVSDAVLDDVVQGNLKATTSHVERQADITRQGRI